MKLLPFVLVCAVALAGCGGGEPRTDASGDRLQSQADGCLIFQNGNKLCGDDAKAYCRGFDTSDEQSRRACESVTNRPTPRRSIPDTIDSALEPVLRSTITGFDHNEGFVILDASRNDVPAPSIRAEVCAQLIATLEIVHVSWRVPNQPIGTPLEQCRGNEE